MDAPVPLVEVTDDGDPLRVGRPHREVDAADVSHRLAVRTQFFPGAIVGALGQQVQIKVGQHLAELVGINTFAGAAAFVHAQAVGKGLNGSTR